MNEENIITHNEIKHETDLSLIEASHSSNGTFKVYALSDPRVPMKPRYIGMTRRLPQRLSKHRTRPNSFDMRRWLAGLSDAGLTPCCIVLHEFATENEATAKEAELIAELPDLLNCQRPTHSTYKPAKPEGIIKTLAEVESEHITAVLELCSGNRLLAAKRLGIGRQTLYNKLKSYGA